MARPPRPEIRDLLLERAAGMIARRESVSLRGLVAGTGVSTMAVYTHFDGMPGLLGAVRQEGFTRLASRLATLSATDDAVADLAAAGGAYVATARSVPDLYALMFEGALPLPDGAAADATLQHLVGAAQRAVDDARFEPGVDPLTLATEQWVLGHGACMLVVTGVLPFGRVEPVAVSGLVHLFRGAGDAPDRARASVEQGWRRGLGAEG